MNDSFFAFSDASDGFSQDEVSKSANGGTELMRRNLFKYVSPDILQHFYFICSRVRDVHPTLKNILWLHDMWSDPESHHLRNKQSRSRFSKLVFVSNFQRTTYQMAYEIQSSETTILHNAIEPIDMTGFTKSRDKINLIYHTTPHRGLELLIPVYKKLSEYFGSRLHLYVYSSFNVYGWPERDKPYEALFQECRDHPHITYCGAVPNDEVREALKQTHIFAYPSIWPETSCIAALEAMSAKNLIVCPNFAALPETCGKFSQMYDWHENVNVHANRFGNELQMAISGLLESDIESVLDYAKADTDSFCGWNYRARQWEKLLQQIFLETGE